MAVAAAPRTRRLEPEAAAQLIANFAARFHQPTLYFAWHAAFPLALTADMLYRMWVNFRLDTQNHPLEIPWVATADLLLSDLVRPVSYEIYEMDGTVRELLLQELRSHSDSSLFPCFGEQRLKDLGAFLVEYISPQLKAQNQIVRQRAQAQELAVTAYTNPPAAIAGLARQLAESIRSSDHAAQVRLASIVEQLTGALTGQPEFDRLQTYTRQRAGLLQGAASPPPSVEATPWSAGGVTLPNLDEKLPPSAADLRLGRLISQAEQALAAGQLDQAAALLDQARQLQPFHPGLQRLQNQLNAAQAAPAHAKPPEAHPGSDQPETVRVEPLQTEATSRPPLTGTFEICFINTTGTPEIQFKSPQGGQTVPFPPDLPQPDLKEFDLLTTRYGAQAETPDLLRSWGQRLFDALFRGPGSSLLDQFLLQAEQTPGNLRLLFDFSTAPQWQNLPWEAISTPLRQANPGVAQRTLLARLLQTDFTRNTLLPQPSAPLRLLAAVLDPHDSGFSGVQAWITSLKVLCALPEKDGQVELTVAHIQRAGPAELNQALYEVRPHVLYLVGRGAYDEQTGRGLLCFPDDKGATEWAPLDVLEDALHKNPPLLVVLSASQAGRAGQTSVFSGLAQRLLNAGVAAVVASLYDASAEGGWFLLSEFTRHLLAHRPPEEAMSLVRQAMQSENYFEWASYAYFTSLREPPPPDRMPPPPPLREATQTPIARYQRKFPRWTLGLTLSQREGAIDWPGLAQEKQGLGFVLVRATEGRHDVDPYFRANWEGAAQAGLLRAAYHTYDFEEDPIAQAEFFQKNAVDALLPGDLPPVVQIILDDSPDLESKPPARSAAALNRSAELQQFIDQLAQRYKRLPVIQTSPEAWNTLLNDSSSFANYPLWLVQFQDEAPSALPGHNWDNRGWAFWQFSDETRLVMGKTNFTRLSWFQGSLEHMAQTFQLPGGQASPVGTQVDIGAHGSVNISGGGTVNVSGMYIGGDYTTIFAQPDLKSLNGQITLALDLLELQHVLNAIDRIVYQPLARQDIRLISDPGPLAEVSDIIQSLMEYYDQIQAIAKQGRIPASLLAWQDELERIIQELERAQQAGDEKIYRTAMARLRRILATQPSNLTATISTVCHSLNLAGFEESMQSFIKQLPQNTDLARKQARGLQDFSLKADSFAALLMPYDRWSAVLAETRRLSQEAVTSPEEILLEMDDLQRRLEPLIASEDHAAQNLKKELDSLAEPIAGSKERNMNQELNKIKRQVELRYIEVIDDFNKQLINLQQSLIDLNDYSAQASPGDLPGPSPEA